MFKHIFIILILIISHPCRSLFTDKFNNNKYILYNKYYIKNVLS